MKEPGMKETPTEERLDAEKLNSSSGTRSQRPALPSDEIPPITPNTPANPSHQPPRQNWMRYKWKNSTLIEKCIFVIALVALLIASPILGTSLASQLTPHQQAQITPIPTLPLNKVTGVNRVLDPERREALFIDQMIKHMTLDEELGQMIMVEWDEGGVFNNDLQYMLVNQHAGGIILYTFNNNIQTQPQVTALTAAIQAHANIPLLISIDQEGGNVNRLDPITGPRPSAREIGATNDPNVAYKQGVSDGQILKQLGINENLAPDVDVQNLSDAVFNASSMVGFEYRMYGTTPDKVASFAGAYLNGLQDQGVIGTLKHWPGLGADIVDPHDALPTLESSQTELNNVDFAPYRTLLAEGNVDMIMSTHELVPAYDKNLPATLSPILIDQVLRQQLGYQGVVITDGLYMKAISQHWSLPQAAVLAVQAGNDILLGPYNTQGVQSVLDALHAAITNGQITKARIDLSVERILALKIKYGMIAVPGNVQP
jgi:beta-N-acetylhexosaminidase